MEKYKNLDGESGVRYYEIGNSYIRVQFAHGAYIYTYTYASAGEEFVEEMKRMAAAGRGLNRYINSFVKDLFESRIPAAPEDKR